MINYLKRIALFEAVLVIAILSLHFIAARADPYAFPNNWFIRDDAYYYFKVAQNIAEGHSSTFDGINITNGYHPLWMLICIPIFALAKYNLVLPLRVLLMVIAVIQAATSVMLYRLIKAHLSHAVAILAAVFWSFDEYIHTTVYKMGLETPIAVFSLVLVIYLLAKFEKEWRTKQIPLKRFAWFGLIAALAMFSRLDLVFFAVIIGIWIIFRNTPIRYFLPLDIAVIFISMTSSVLLRTGFEEYNTVYASSAIEATVIAIILKSIALYFFGAYQHPRSTPIWKTLRQTFVAIAVGSIFTAGIYILLEELGMGRNFPRSAFALDFIISLTLISASRLAAYWFANPNRIQAETPLAQFKSNWKTWLREGAAFYGVLGGLLFAYMVFSHFTFGTSSPVSGQIKRWWGSMGVTAYERPAGSWDSYFGLGTDAYQAALPFTEIVWQVTDKVRNTFIRGADMEGERFFTVLLGFVMVWLILLFLNKRRATQALTNLGFIPLMAGSAIHVLSYTATSYGGAKEWYWVSQMILLTLACSLFFDFVLRPLRRVQYLNIVLISAALLYGANSANRFWHGVDYAMPRGYFPPDRPLMEVIGYLEANTAPGEVIGRTGGGNVGYFIKDRTIVNMDGLINSYEYFQILKAGEGPMY
ncbi:MAG: hypothetical protein HYU84_11505, partial [Chloroflexi bacterium]|nr:hypothetical protein [Chloroflexota bacterium]